MFEEALCSYLTSSFGIFALASDRVYPLMLPQNCPLPAVTYQKVSGDRLHSLQGDTGYTTPVFQITSRADTYEQCKVLAEQVRLSLQNFTGTMGTSGFHIGAVLLIGEVEGYEPDTNSWYNNMDFKFHYEEGV